MKAILCGYHWAGCKALRLLLDMNYEVFVFTHKAPPYVPSLLDYCKENYIPYSIEKISKDNLPFIPDIICSIYYRYIIHEEIINHVDKKIFNLHPSLLPDYKGCSSLTWAMINNEKNVGFTYHYLTSKVDSGNILIQKEIEVEPFDLQSTLYNRVMFESIKYFKNAVKLVLEEYPGIPQTSEIGRYLQRGCPMNGEINDIWDEEKIKRFIRSMIYPPLPYAHYKGHEVKTFSEFIELKTKLNKQ